ncbi:hypothetical protein G4B88_017229 [Cannabis sativa]|uniref:Uncharacterized protein n=1 Tax=Cannabis sativa TaxID=3483 RepID=A0A7J6G0G0_CANSA|nr:hypothetical protein G4B88_017229 [Cannabis sativa]
MNAPIIDPLQGDFPEVIEEYLEHGVMKCIAFNRRGTLLAVTKIIFEQLVNDDKLNPVIKFMNKAQREEANVLLAILTKNMLSTISECLLLTSARITSRFMETSTPLFSMFLQSQIISITEANQIKGPSIFAAFRMSPKFLLLQTIGVTLPLAFLFFEWASRSRGRPETIEEPNNFAASLSPFSELGFVTDGIFWLPFVPFPCTPPLLVLDVLTVPFVPPISPLCLSFPSTVVVLLPESPGAISGSKSRRLIGISTSRINFGLLIPHSPISKVFMRHFPFRVHIPPKICLTLLFGSCREPNIFARTPPLATSALISKSTSSSRVTSSRNCCRSNSTLSSIATISSTLDSVVTISSTNCSWSSMEEGIKRRDGEERRNLQGKIYSQRKDKRKKNPQLTHGSIC